MEVHELEESIGYKLLPAGLALGQWMVGTAVPAAEKERARANADAVGRGPRPAGVELWVRVNAPGTALAEADLAVLGDCPLDGLRVPRAEDPDQVRAVADRTPLRLQLLLEFSNELPAVP